MRRWKHLKISKRNHRNFTPFDFSFCCNTHHSHFSVFTKMPDEHYMIVAKLLLGCASDDIPNADVIRTVIKDMWDIRMAKIRKSVDVLIKGSSSYAKIDHLTLMEINTMRPILPHAMDQIHRLKLVGFLRFAVMSWIKVSHNS